MNKQRLTNTPAPQTPAPQLVPVQEPQTHDSDKECSDEEDFELLIGFDPEKAKSRLYSLPNSITLAIDIEQQKDIFIEVGVNLSNENPWKQISKKFLEDHLSSDTYEMSVLKEKLKEIEQDPMLLLGYVPHLSDETRDNFIIFLDDVACKEASEIIKRLEACERRKIMKSIVKYPRPYRSMGSEQAVDSYVSVKRVNTVNIELQSVYPMRYTQTSFSFRFADDVRDGYVELLPDKKVHFENVHRRMIDRAVQSGSFKVTEEQQTDPTFPTNAWSQYLYELEEADAKVEDAETITSGDDKKEEEITFMSMRKKKEEVVIEEKIEEPTVSQQVVDLLQVLEFNQVDMYRDDYKFIGKEEVSKYTAPFLEEICCFANIPKCRGRHIISMDWHPEISGVCVAAYGYNLKTKKIHRGDDVDVIKRAIIDSNPILIWSFDDPLYPKLELEALREISCISFCPYDGNIIVGGTVNGQLIIWDIKGRLVKVESGQILTPEQQKHRTEIREYLKWNTKGEDTNRIVLPAVVSNIDKSHEDAITGIKWLAQNFQCTSKGLLKEDRQNDSKFRQFTTTSLDGKICFWDLDWLPSAEDSIKIEKVERKIKLPDELMQEISPLSEKDKIFMPHFFLNITRPISSYTFNEGEIIYECQSKPKKFSLNNRMLFEAISKRKESFNPKMAFGSTLGEVISCKWDGDDFTTGAILNKQTMIQENFADVHDGPVVSVQRNPFMTDSFISIGGLIFALWHDKYLEGPIFWRRCKSLITGIQWSLDRPSVFYLIFENGTLEIWDLYSRIDVPSLSESIGGNILSCIKQHKLPLSKRLLAIGDHNSSLRIFTIPNSFAEQRENEEKFFKKFIEKEVQRKRDQDQWREEWFEANKDIIDAKKDVEILINDEKEKKDKIMKEIEDKRAAMAEAEAKKLAKKKARKLTYDLPERLEKKWNDQNYKRLLKIIMERKKIDKELLAKQSKFLKDRMHFNEQKKVAIKQSIAKIEDDLSAVRSRLIPVEEYQATRDELVAENVDGIFIKPLDYKSIEEEALEEIKILPDMQPMTLADIHRRCKVNREILNQSFGGGAKAKFERFRNEREQNRSLSRYSSMSQLPGSRSVTFSTEPKEVENSLE